MGPLYQQDLAYIQAAAFGALARGAAPEIVRRLKCAPVPIRRVVDAGCGAGPLSAALVEAGFEVTGIDISAELLAIARNAAPGARFIQGSTYETPIPACEAIVALGEPLTYHAEDVDADARVGSFFRAASEVLPVGGGMLIFDVIESVGLRWRPDIGAQARIGPYWPTPRKTIVRGRWSGASKPSGESTSSTGVEVKSPGYGSSIRAHSWINWRRAGSQRKRHNPMAGSRLVRAGAHFSRRACVGAETRCRLLEKSEQQIPRGLKARSG